MKTEYRSDARGPALCVKCHRLADKVPAECEASDSQQEAAHEMTSRDWWGEAEAIAKRHGFRNVYSAGRMGGWLFTNPLPEHVTDDEGSEEPGEYPADFVAEIEALLNRAPDMYAHNLAQIVADDEEAAENAAHRAAIPARLALALHRYVQADSARDVPGDTPAAQARAVLADYLDALLDDEDTRELTEDEARIVADARGTQ